MPLTPSFNAFARGPALMESEATRARLNNDQAQMAMNWMNQRNELAMTAQKMQNDFFMGNMQLELQREQNAKDAQLRQAQLDIAKAQHEQEMALKAKELSLQSAKVDIDAAQERQRLIGRTSYLEAINNGMDPNDALIRFAPIMGENIPASIAKQKGEMEMPVYHEPSGTWYVNNNGRAQPVPAPFSERREGTDESSIRSITDRQVQRLSASIEKYDMEMAKYQQSYELSLDPATAKNMTGTQKSQAKTYLTLKATRDGLQQKMETLESELASMMKPGKMQILKVTPPTTK